MAPAPFVLPVEGRSPGTRRQSNDVNVATCQARGLVRSSAMAPPEIVDEIFHTYSACQRGTERTGGLAYNFLDLTALGRHEGAEQ
jgi:Bacterial protein of unknown function (DUF899)